MRRIGIQLVQVVSRYRPFTSPDQAEDKSNDPGWYAPVIIQITREAPDEVLATTCFTGRFITSGNVILLPRGKGSWTIVSDAIWAK